MFIGIGNGRDDQIANHGSVRIQAHNDLMELIARGEISVVSTEVPYRNYCQKTGRY